MLLEFSKRGCLKAANILI